MPFSSRKVVSHVRNAECIVACSIICVFELNNANELRKTKKGRIKSWPLFRNTHVLNALSRFDLIGLVQERQPSSILRMDSLTALMSGYPSCSSNLHPSLHVTPPYSTLLKILDSYAFAFLSSPLVFYELSKHEGFAPLVKALYLFALFSSQLMSYSFFSSC